MLRNSEKFRTSQHFLECLAKFREKIIKIGPKFNENCRKIKNFAEIRKEKKKKSLTNFYEDFEFGAVRRRVNHLDLDKC